MEEKERYEWGYNGKFLKYYILDTQTKDELGYEEVFDLLNQQDKKIKKLKEKNQQLKEQLEIFKKFNEALQQDNLDLSYDKLDTAYEYAKEMAENWEKDYQEEIQQLREDLQAKDILVNTYMSVVGTLDNAKQLKQSQKQLAIEKLEKVKKCIHSYVRKRNKECAVGYYNEIPKYRFDEIIENQIKSLKGEE